MSDKREEISIDWSCMDCRATKDIIDRVRKGKLKPDDRIVRDAGVNPEKMPYTIADLGRSYRIVKVMSRPHTGDDTEFGCGAMKTVIALGDGIKSASDLRFSHLLADQFKGMNFGDSRTLEKLNAELQAKAMCDCFGTDNVESELMHITWPAPHKEHTLVISNPPRAGDYESILDAAGDEPDNCYCIHGLQEDVGTDIELAVKRLHIHRLVFVALPEEPRAIAETRMRNTINELRVLLAPKEFAEISASVVKAGTGNMKLKSR
jgi:hypothetical protein